MGRIHTLLLAAALAEEQMATVSRTELRVQEHLKYSASPFAKTAGHHKPSKPNTGLTLGSYKYKPSKKK